MSVDDIDENLPSLDEAKRLISSLWDRDYDGNIDPDYCQRCEEIEVLPDLPLCEKCALHLMVDRYEKERNKRIKELNIRFLALKMQTVYKID